MTRPTRRQFVSGALGATLATMTLGDPLRYAPVTFANYEAPDPNDPNDPNAIVDPDKEIAKPYVGWKPGELDLHFIHTGVTENTFHIYPDGTTALVDCGDRQWQNFGKVSWNPTHSDDAACTPKPNASRRPGEWVARYISRLLPDRDSIDYVLASHFHTDHIGDGRHGAGMTSGRGEDYQLSGIAHVGEFYHFGTAFDRGYPSYDAPTTWAPKERENLVKFWKYKERTDGLRREEFQVGALDQIKLLHEPQRYDFHIRNLARNGVAWTGQEGQTRDFFALNQENYKNNTNENTRSLAMVVQYGDFRFYTGGDLCGTLVDSEGKDADYEGYVGNVVGPCDVCKTNHHSSGDAMRPSFVSAVQSRVYITCCWWQGHLNAKTSAIMCDEKLYRGPRLLCPTDTHPLNADMLRDKPWRNRLCERGGHVVVKVYDNGARYKVYFLTADDESMRVNLVFGPFESTGRKRQRANA